MKLKSYDVAVGVLMAAASCKREIAQQALNLAIKSEVEYIHPIHIRRIDQEVIFSLDIETAGRAFKSSLHVLRLFMFMLDCILTDDVDLKKKAQALKDLVDSKRI